MNVEVVRRIGRALGVTNLGRVIASTYHRLRLALVAIAILLPLYLWLVGQAIWDVPWQDSLSAYYHAGAEGETGELRDEFVGALVAGGACLLVYRGFTGLEHWALNIGGVALILVALVPVGASWVHGAAAITFFAMAFYVALFRSWDTLTPSLIPDERTRQLYRSSYVALAIAIVIFVGASTGLALSTDSTRVIFWLETAGVWSFGVYWAVKSLELRRSHADEAANEGRIAPRNYGLRDVFRQVAVE